MKLSERLAAWANHIANEEYEMCTQAADLLDECESFIESRTCMCIPKLKCTRCEMLAKLRAQERD